MHVIDYLPWPIYVLIGIFSAFGILKYIVLNKNLGVQEKIGAIMMVFGLIALLLEKIVEETTFHINYNVFLNIFLWQ